MNKAALLLTLAVAGACAVAPPPRTPAAIASGLPGPGGVSSGAGAAHRRRSRDPSRRGSRADACGAERQPSADGPQAGRARSHAELLSRGAQLPRGQDEADHRRIAGVRGDEAPPQGRRAARARRRARRFPLARHPRHLSSRLLHLHRHGPRDSYRRASPVGYAARATAGAGSPRCGRPRPIRRRSTTRSTDRSRWAKRIASRRTSGGSSRQSSSASRDSPVIRWSGPRYWRHLLLALVEENVQYVESRSIRIDASIVLDVRTRDPDFDVKFIAAAGRSASRDRIAQMLANTLDLRAKEPELIVGFDLVEEEDRTNTNLYYAEQLLAAQREAARRGLDLPLYLHSGETNWAENENLYDAVLLGAARIGHGLALIKHPRLMQIVKERGIAVEVCPISNQLLGYVVGPPQPSGGPLHQRRLARGPVHRRSGDLPPVAVARVLRGLHGLGPRPGEPQAAGDELARPTRRCAPTRSSEPSPPGIAAGRRSSPG